LSSAREYEKSLDARFRKANGVFYTPDALVDCIVARVVAPLSDRCGSLEELLALRICDPACGAGNFLVAARAELLARARAIAPRAGERALARSIEKHCLVGVDRDEAALRIASAQMPGARFLSGDALARASFFADESFDAVIGNPPYGAETASNLSGDSAALFMELAHRLTRSGGSHGFVVPKPFLYSSRWRSIRETLWDGLAEVVDCGKAWAEVKLEQVIYVHAKGRKLPAYVSRELGAEGATVVRKSAASEFGLILNGSSGEEIELGQRLARSCARLGDFALNSRGAPLQAELAARPGRGLLPAYGGKQLSRYALAPEPKGFIAAKTAASDPRARAARGVILAQNIVAHVARPEPHLKIIATLAPRELVVLDTINRIEVSGGYAPEFLLALLNSRLVAWYVYRFIAGRAIRTIHFDSPVTDRIPIPRLDLATRADAKAHDALASLARTRLARPHDARLDAAIDSLVFDLYCLGEGEARAVRGIGV
jgi:hypothetical protein